MGSRRRGFTLIELLIGLLFVLLLVTLAVAGRRGARHGTQTHGAARVVASFLDAARERARSTAEPVAVGFPGGGTRSAYILEGQSHPRVTRVLALSKDFPEACIFLGGPWSDPPADPGLEAAPPDPAAWAGEHAQDHLLIFTPSGSVLSHCVPWKDGAFSILVSAGVETASAAGPPGFDSTDPHPPFLSASQVSEPYTVRISPLGATEVLSGAGTDSPPASASSIQTAAVTGPSPDHGPSGSPPRLESLKVLPDPDRHPPPPGVDALVPAGGYLTLVVGASNPGGGPLFCNWIDHDGGQLSSPDEGRMVWDHDQERWVSRWHWHPPPGAMGGTYRVECVVRDSWNRRAEGDITATLNLEVKPPSRRLIFGSDRTGVAQLFSVFEDGLGEFELGEPPPGGVDHVGGWSPDGARFVLYSTRGGSADLYVVNADGSDVRRITRSSEGEGSPEWSPTGTRIVFNSPTSDARDIWVVNADGSNPRNLTQSPDNEQLCSWQGGGYLPGAFSPDEALIAYREGSGLGVVEVRPFGMGARHSISSGLAFADDPCWAPDSRSVLMIGRASPGDETELYLYPVLPGWTGTPIRLTTGARAEDAPRFSPDGQQILFVSSLTGTRKLHLARMDWTPPNPRVVPSSLRIVDPRSSDSEMMPCWLDADTISFVRAPGGQRDIYTLDLPDGTPENVTAHPAEDNFYGWTR